MNEIDAFVGQCNKLHLQCLAGQASAVTSAQKLGAMLAARKAKCKHGEWLPLVEKLSFPRRTATHYMEAARTANMANPKKLAYTGSKPGVKRASNADARPTLKHDPDPARDDFVRLSNDIAKDQPLPPVNGEYSFSGDHDRNEWFTPAPVLDMAREVLKVIDFDPFSSPKANKTVGARRFYTREDDALARETWTKTPQDSVWMNPPYGVLTISKAVARFCQEWDAGNIGHAIVLTNNATDTAWFRELAERAAALCFTYGRVQFNDFEGKAVGSNTRGQTFFYFGGDVHRFNTAFKAAGMVLVKVPS